MAILDESQDDLLAEDEGQDPGAELSSMAAQYGIPENKSPYELSGLTNAYDRVTQSAESTRKALQDARARILARKYDKAAALLAISSGLLAPTRTGNFFESFGNMAGALQGPVREKRDFELQRDKDLFGVNTGLAGIDDRLAQSALTLESLKAKLAAQAANAPLEKVMLPGRARPVGLPRSQARGRELWTPSATRITNVIGGEKKFWDTAAEGTAKKYVDQFAAAEMAPGQIDRAQRTVKLLKEGVYTGAGADFKLAVGKVARTVGIDYGGTDIANTEQLASDLAAGTLALIKPSGLGGGTGFSNADRDFLVKVANGVIDLDKETLMRAATLHEKAQRNVVKAWNDTYKRLSNRKDYRQHMDDLGWVPIDIENIDGEMIDFEKLPNVPANPVQTHDTDGEPETISFEQLK